MGQRRPDAPDNFFLLGGFDWQTGEINAWRLAFDASANAFAYRPVLGLKGSGFFYASDSKPAVSHAIRRTREFLKAADKDDTQLDSEPLDVLAEIIRDREHHSIGGAPQFVKAYRHLNTQLFTTLWPTGDGVVLPHTCGRPLLPGEKNLLPIFDPARGFRRPDAEEDSAADLDADADADADADVDGGARDTDLS